MDSITSIFLGVIQGLTEFLPVSSSGHLVFFQNVLGFEEPELLLDISLHVGTLLAVCIFFRADLKKMIWESWNFSADILSSREKISSIVERPHVLLALWVLAGTVPTAIIGLLFRSPLEDLFGDVNMVGIMLICTGLILAVTRFISKEYNQRKEIGLLTALAVGVAQGLAIIPGISRSGATIVSGIVCGLESDLAARFSFLLSIPAIIGAMVVQLGSGGLSRSDIIPIAFGLLSSAIVGLIALKILMGIVSRGNLSYFAPYCWALGIFIII
ncbi:undecaprenyl-diphosphate phosphatase [Deltaproteobacteria bacterium]|nr:undecaprenyl-diphosphate phosphatase [Deltaproteobacteria bacterium]